MHDLRKRYQRFEFHTFMDHSDFAWDTRRHLLSN
jgi:hypothetical protein